MDYVKIESSEKVETVPLLGNRVKNEEHETSILKLIIFGSIIVSPGIIGGMALSYSAIALPQMKLNINDASWFGAMVNFGSSIGSTLTGLIVDKFGRRPSIIISVIPSILGWMLLMLDFQRTITFSGRILTGINSGCMYISQIYAGESIVVNHPHWRNSLNVCQGIAFSLGMTLTYALGRVIPYQGVAATASFLSIILLLINYLYIPESPKWLYHKGLIKEAKRSEKLLGIHQPILKDIDLVETPSCIRKASHFFIVIRKLIRKDVYKPLLVITTLYIMIMFSGGPVIIACMVDVTTVSPETCQSIHVAKHRFSPHENNSNIVHSSTSKDGGYELDLISSILFLGVASLVSIVVRYVGIKKLYYFSSACMSISLCLLAISIFRFNNKYVQNVFDTLNVVSVWCISFFYYFGVANIPSSILGELFPHNSKGFASIPAVVFSTSSSFAVKLHPYLFLYFGGTLYIFYAVILLASIIFVAKFLPETVGKTLDEIGEFFSA